jgi:membrane-associated protease RseP (regulator of RpoE activity)
MTNGREQPSPSPHKAQPAPMPRPLPASPPLGLTRGPAGDSGKSRTGLILGAILIGACLLGAGAVGTGMVNVPGFGNPVTTSNPATSTNAAGTESQAEAMSDISGNHYIGLTMQTLNPAAVKSLNLQTSRNEGVAITRIWRAGPAEAAGLQVNDIIIAVDGVPVRSMNEVSTKTRLTEIGDRYQVTIERNGVVQSIPVRVEKWMGRTAACTVTCGG